MTSKEKAENFDDLDTLDEDQWGEEPQGAADISDGSGSSVDQDLPSTKKKSSGGFLFGLIVLSLLGGGSWYAYQNGLIPGLKNENTNVAKAPESSDSEVAPSDLSVASTQQGDMTAPLENADLPPMPASQDSGSIVEAEQDASQQVENNPLTGDATSSVTDTKDEEDGVLTPFPVDGDAAQGTESALQPLELADSGDEGLPAVAEKDGMLVQDASSELLDPEAKSMDIPAETPPEDASGSSTELPATDPSEELASGQISDAEPLDELALTDQVDQSPSSADAPQNQAELTQSAPETPAAQAVVPVDGDTELDLETDDLASTQTQEVSEPPSSVSDSSPVVDTVPAGEADSATQPLPDASGKDAVSQEDPVTEEASSLKSPEPEKEAVQQAPSEASPQDDQPEIKNEAPETSSDQEQKTAGVKESASTSKPDAPVKKAPPSPTWKLKSAKPGSAVLFDARTGDVKTVETGDRVPGLGKVKSISQVNGKWVVKGSTGKVSQ